MRTKRVSLKGLDAYVDDVLKRNPDFVDAIGKMMIADMVAEWGERCPDDEPGCPICDAWREFDADFNA